MAAPGVVLQEERVGEDQGLSGGRHCARVILCPKSPLVSQWQDGLSYGHWLPVLRRLRHLGLRAAIFGSFGVALLVLLLLAWGLIRMQVLNRVNNRLEVSGKALAHHLATWVAHSEHPQEVLLQVPLASASLAGVALVNASGQVEAVSQDTLDWASVVAQWEAGSRPARVALPGSLVLLAEPGAASGATVLVVVDERFVEDVKAGLRSGLLLSVLVGVLVFAAAMALVGRILLDQPLERMTAMAHRLAEADLTQGLEQGGADGLGRLAVALDRLCESLRETIGRARGVGEAIGLAVGQLSRSGVTVNGGAATVIQRVEEARGVMAELLTSLNGLAEQVDILGRGAEEGTATASAMASTHDDVTGLVEQLGAAAAETTGAIGEMTRRITEVARAVGALHGSAEETSVSIQQMDISIGQVETNANETARLSENVLQDAATAGEALQTTLAGIERIRGSSREALQVIESLGRRTSEIGNILDVIDDVAEQTNLLALNAAIIAAQAGEHGKGFAVVAEEIKELAERTGASTKEIADLIAAVQAESQNARAAVEQGFRTVEEGVELGREAEGALKKISASASKSTLMVRAIARATIEQSRSSKSVTAAVQRIADAVEQVSRATSEQERGSEQMTNSAQHMLAVTTQVERATEAQVERSRQIGRSLGSIREMAGAVSRARGAQAAATERVLTAVEAIRTVAVAQVSSARQLESVIEDLRTQADVLRVEVQRFKV
jgi:methyl-accepting chemotaxis protein